MQVEIIDDLLICSVIEEDGGEIDHFVLNKYGIRAENVTLSSSFTQSNVDSLIIQLELINPFNHTVILQALVQAYDTTYVDSTQLFDDGNHYDGVVDDGIWGNYIRTVPIENDFIIDIVTTDLDSNITFVTQDVARFTTIGPIIYDGFSPYLIQDSIPNPGDILSFKIHLKNEGQISQAENIEARLYSNDHRITIENFWSPYDNINAGNTVESSQGYSLVISSDFSQDTTLNLPIVIWSEGYHFWSDSMRLDIIISGLSEDVKKIPTTYALEQNYPNPFNPTTQIEVYNIVGQRVEIVLNKWLQAGNHEVEFNAANQSSGVYFYRIEAGEFQDVKKMILLK